MKLFVRKELVLVALALMFGAGEAVGFEFVGLAGFWPLIMGLVVVLALFGYGCAWQGWRWPAVFLIGVAIALGATERRKSVFDAIACQHGLWQTEFTVDSVETRHGEWVAFLSESRGIAVKVLFKLAADQPLPERGEVWSCAGWLERTDLTDRRRRNFWVKGNAAYAKRLKPSPFYYFNRLRRRLTRSASMGLDDEVASLNRAMLLGERSTLPWKTKDRFVTAGTMHVFAISGLHVGVIAVSMLVVLMLFYVPYRVARALLLPLLWGYVLMIGCSPSAVRAALMGSLYVLGSVCWRRSCGLIAWAQAFIVVQALSPEKLFSAGSMLSFTVMLGMLLFAYWAQAVRLPRWAQSFGFVVAAWLAGLPIGAAIFSRITVGGLLANLLAVPLAGIAVACGFLGMLTGLAVPLIGIHLNNAAGLAIRAMDGVSAAVSCLPFASFEVGRWRFGMVIGAYAIMLGLGLAVYYICRRHRQILK